MSPSQDRRKKRRGGNSQDMRKRSWTPSGTTAWDTAVLPLLTRQRPEEMLLRLHQVHLDRAVLPLTIRSGTTAQAVLPSIIKRHYRCLLKPLAKTPRKFREKVRERAVLPLGKRYYRPSGTTAPPSGTTAGAGSVQWNLALFRLFSS